MEKHNLYIPVEIQKYIDMEPLDFRTKLREAYDTDQNQYRKIIGDIREAFFKWVKESLTENEEYKREKENVLDELQNDYAGMKSENERLQQIEKELSISKIDNEKLLEELNSYMEDGLKKDDMIARLEEDSREIEQLKETVRMQEEEHREKTRLLKELIDELKKELEETTSMELKVLKDFTTDESSPSTLAVSTREPTITDLLPRNTTRMYMLDSQSRSKARRRSRQKKRTGSSKHRRRSTSNQRGSNKQKRYNYYDFS